MTTATQPGEIDLAEIFPRGCFAFRAESAIAMPAVAAGDFIVCRPGTPDQGQFAAVSIGGQTEVRVRRDDWLVRTGCREAHLDEPSVRVMGVVVGVVRRVGGA